MTDAPFLIGMMLLLQPRTDADDKTSRDHHDSVSWPFLAYLSLDGAHLSIRFSCSRDAIASVIYETPAGSRFDMR